MMPEASPIALHCEGLSKSFGAVTPVGDATFHVTAGSILALLGPSGCGKTTTLRLIAGLDQPDAGTIVLGGTVVQGPGVSVPPERRRVGLVFQDYALFPHLDVRTNVGFGLSRRNGRAARVAETLELVGLSALASRMPHELSGGQQQRVALARALAPNPRVVLLDEPFSNLDAALRNDLRNDVRRVLRESGATAVFVTHDQEEALSLTDQVAVMIDGRVLQVAPPYDVYRHPVSRVVADFIGHYNVIDGAAMGRMVVCELGTVRIQDAMSGPVDLYVRPEALQVTSDSNGQGVIEARQFFGYDQLLHVRLDSGLVVECRVEPTFIAPEGVRVRIQINGDVVAFTRAGTDDRGRRGAPVTPPPARPRLA